MTAKPTDWYSMKLNERHAPDNNSMVTRVPGGWLFENMQGVCFIPFNNEFHENNYDGPF